MSNVLHNTHLNRATIKKKTSEIINFILGKIKIGGKNGKVL